MLGQALVARFESAVSLLERMTILEDQGVRRSIGVVVHFFAKRRPGDVERMKRLLALLSLLVEDKRVFVVKGVGWGLKTVGKHQPRLVEDYLQQTMRTKRISKLMLRKATAYLDEGAKRRLVERWQHSVKNKR